MTTSGCDNEAVCQMFVFPKCRCKTKKVVLTFKNRWYINPGPIAKPLGTVNVLAKGNIPITFAHVGLGI